MRYRIRDWPEEKRIHDDLFRLERELGIPMVATNDSHYICEDDAHAQDVMLCIQTGKSMHDTNRMKFSDQPVLREERGRDGRAFDGAEQRADAARWGLPSAAT